MKLLKPYAGFFRKSSGKPAIITSREEIAPSVAGFLAFTTLVLNLKNALFSLPLAGNRFLFSDPADAIADRVGFVEPKLGGELFKHLELWGVEAYIHFSKSHRKNHIDIKVRTLVQLYAHGMGIIGAYSPQNSSPLAPKVTCRGLQQTRMVTETRQRKKQPPPDGFALDFDSLIGTQVVTENKLGQLALVLASGSSKAFDPNNSLDHTLDHLDCPACRTTNRALVADSANLATMPFPEASRTWMLLRMQDQDLKPRAHETTQGYLNALEKFFGAARLCDITPGHVRGYQLARQANRMRRDGEEIKPWLRLAGNSTVNHEISVLGQMLTHCRLWHRIKPYYFPLNIPKWSPREILSEEEEEQLWEKASRHPEAALAYWVATITNNTTASGIELRGLRLKNLFLRDEGISEIYIPGDSVKNTSRPRKIALNPTARWAVVQCFKRALKLGSCEPEHYLFPFWMKRNVYDPARPASRWFLRKSWEKLRSATGFVGLNPHDLRHNCITRLLENDINEHTVIAIAGHVSRQMLEYYAHHRRGVKYAAVLAIEPKKKPVKSESGPTDERKTG